MSKKGNPKYKSFSQVCEDLDDIINNNPFDINLLNKYKEYFDSIKKFNYLECAELEGTVITDILNKNKVYKKSFVKWEILKEYFSQEAINSIKNYVKISQSKDINPNSEKSNINSVEIYKKELSEKLIIEIANALEWEDFNEKRNQTLSEALKSHPELINIQNLLNDNFELCRLVTSLISYTGEQLVFEWLSSGAIDISQLYRFVDTTKTPKENIDYFMRKCNFSNSKRGRVSKVVYSYFKNGTKSDPSHM